MKYIYNEGKMQELVVILQNSSALDMIRIVLSLVFGVDRVPYLASGLKSRRLSIVCFNSYVLNLSFRFLVVVL